MLPNIVRKLTGLAILTGIVALGMARPAEAAFKLRLTDETTGDSVTVTDGGGNDTSGTTGVITFNDTLGGTSSFIVNVTTGISKPILPVLGSGAEMDLNSVNVTSSAPATLRIELTDTGFDASAAGRMSTVVGGTINGGDANLLAFQAWKDPENREFEQGSITPGEIPLIFVGDGFVGEANTTHGPLTDPYSMTLQALVTFNVAGVLSFDFNSTNNVIPEPGTIAMALSALPLLGCVAGYRRWRRHEQV